ncbi:sensor histidine kinase [Pseudoduganella violaceinigra]|uniref:sensor histidine kinase n=1 Tax=Pseudoduganella violaceinigra TaxID=246602 RepID=UPI000685BFE8|nr:histidine kinase [Pseudoduganella violaceinigra]
MRALHFLRVLGASALAWSAICLTGAMSSYGALLQRGANPSFGELLGSWIGAHGLMVVFSAVLYLALQRWPQALASPRGIGRAYLLVLLLFLPLECLFSAQLQKMSLSGLFVELTWTTFTFVTVAGIRIWQLQRARETDNLSLRLELERQRLAALRGQLEPHFLFNALNAVSALVRMDDKGATLTAVSRLSGLLRYAQSASARDWVTLAEELQFVRDYLSLQSMRYGERLRVAIEGDSGAVLSADCPPLLLQPLVENALRHDLDCHDGEGDILLRFAEQGGVLHIHISNSVRETAPNPGLGMGLRNIEARLRLACGSGAALRTARAGGRFVAEIHMPMYFAA